jgi:hypothetical protein
MKSQRQSFLIKIVLMMKKLIILKPLEKKKLKIKNGMEKLILFLLSLLDGVVINILLTMVLKNLKRHQTLKS